MELIGSGQEADVYALDERRVLRRYRHGGDVAAEAEAMIHLAALGYPVPHVYDAAGPDLVLERLAGPTMAAGDLPAPEAARLLAELHRRLHALPPRAARRPEDRILHLDLHPENVMMTARGPVVIDWRNVAEGPPDVDVALSAIILGQVAVDEAHPMVGPAAAMLREFLPAAGGDPLAGLDRALAVRRAQMAEHAEAAAALVAGLIRS